MPATCPNGHRSLATDYCDSCGVAIGVPPVEAAEEETACPNCGSSTGSGGSCPACGFVLGAGDTLAPWVSQQWEVVVRPDRTYFDMLEPDGMEFPADPYSGRIGLTGDHVSIGRYSKGKGITPDIDLSRDLEDTGVSHRHAVLMRQPSGSWALVDQESTNGSFLNAEEDPIPPNQPVALSHGDQIHVGAWTTLTLERLVLVHTGHTDQDSRPSKDTRNIAHGRRRVEIDLLGPLRLRVKGEDVAVTAHLERAVLAYLAINVGTSVSVGNLEAALWGDREPQNSNKALQTYIVNLRKRMPEGTIETVPSGYCLQGARDFVDVVRFERRCARGRALLASGHPGASVALLTSALELWRGEPIPDLSEWPEWSAVTMGLRERHACAEEDRFDGRLQLGDHEALVPDLYPAVEAQPLRQRRWAQLMLALYRCNRQKEASNEFRRLGSVLEEYGFVQSPELVTLEEGIVLNRPELQWIPPREPGDGPPPTAA
jgi:DNA-binding SARP family transcriptional activator